MVVDPDAWMDDASTPLNPTTEEDKTPFSNIDETAVIEPEEVVAQMEAEYSKRNGPQGLRQQTSWTYARLPQIFDEPMPQPSKPRYHGWFHAQMHVQERQLYFYDTTLSQYSMKRGIKNLARKLLRLLQRSYINYMT